LKLQRIKVEQFSKNLFILIELKKNALFLLISKSQYLLIIHSMKKAAFIIIILLLTVKTFAQAEPANYAAALNKFKLFYNQGKPDSIFSMFSPELKADLPLDKFKPTTDQLKSQLGELVKTEFVKYSGTLAVYKATFKNNVFLLNLGLNANNKFTGLLLSAYQENAPASAAVNAELTESPVIVKTLAGSISGSLVMPKEATGKVPLVIIVPDAGATDRNGNNPKTGLTANTYKLLAIDLGNKGIATLRYDKRHVGESVSTNKESQLRFEDYSDDVVSLVTYLNGDPRFSKIIVFGHGEGALAGMLATPDEPVQGLIIAEANSDQAEKILTDQMKSKPQFLRDEFKTVLDSMKKGKTIDKVDISLYYIARPSIQPFLMSWCRYDPPRVLKRVKIPALVIQGTNDLTVPADNADKFKKGKSDAVVLAIKGMNHILREAPADPEKNMATYSEPDLPLKPELVSGIVDFISKIK